MALGYWHDLMSTGLKVPTDRPIDELTVELTEMLGSPDPAVRDGIALQALLTWIAAGVYDDHLAGLGDGMVSGLKVGVGEIGSDSVFPRSASARIATECLARARTEHLLSANRLLTWGDALATWLLRERDTRAWVTGHGWAHALAQGADAIGELAMSPHLATPELTALLDVIADRVLMPETPPLVCGELDRLAGATRQVLMRNLVPHSVIEPWLARIAGGANVLAVRGDRDPYLATHNAQTFLRCLHLHLELGSPAVPRRADLLLSVVDALRATNPFTFRPTTG